MLFRAQKWLLLVVVLVGAPGAARVSDEPLAARTRRYERMVEERRELDRATRGANSALVLDALREELKDQPTAGLVPLLRHRYWEIRKSAAEALGRRRAELQREDLRAALAGALEAETDIYALADLIRVVGAARAPQAARRLTTLMLEHKETFIRQEAAVALAGLRQKESVPALLRAVEDPNLQVSVAALYGLASVGDRAALPVLRQSARQGPLPRREAGIHGLAALGDRESVPYLRELLANPEERLAVQAAHALGKLKAVEAAEALAEALLRGNARVRNAADAALGQIGGVEVLRALLTRLEESQDPALVRVVARQYHQVDRELKEVTPAFRPEDLGSLAAVLTAALPKEDLRNSGGRVRADQIRRIQRLDHWYFIRTDYGHEGHIFAVCRERGEWRGARAISGWIA